jgi:hypothetical protein
MHINLALTNERAMTWIFRFGPILQTSKLVGWTAGSRLISERGGGYLGMHDMTLDACREILIYRA